MGSDLLVDVRDHCLHLTFNRPEARNATTPDMLNELADTLARAETDPNVRCVLLKGTGDHFCGGGDVKGFGTTLDLARDERRIVFEQRVLAAARLLSILERFPKPIVTAARGSVAGMGISFALASDFVVGGEDCFFVFAHTKLGLCPDSGLSFFLPRIVGQQKARQLVLRGARVDSEEALRLGLIERRIPNEEVDAACDALLAKLVRGAPLAMQSAKALLNGSLSRGIGEQLRMEAEAVGKCAASADFEEGVRAFLEKRAAQFGRK